ncbi:MAG: GAF domain-containing protein [Myxococcales bacterium]|nr:GAF domain-containing protein [Myxococcales bacterium]
MSSDPRTDDSTRRFKAVLEGARALIRERNLDTLLQRVLSEAARVVDAERGSLFLVDPITGELWTKVAQGIGSDREIRLPAGTGIVGHVARTGAIVNLVDAYDDPRFSRSIDHKTGYRTRALLAVPMMDMQGHVVGVLQTLNKTDGVFTAEDADVLTALGGQAAAAIENARLYEEITNLFEGFVKASVVAIEQRDPTTGGHSERVASLTLGLCDAVQAIGGGQWKGSTFSHEQRREIRYAALLHDFGKVGVREDVLVKAHKLYPMQFELIKARFDFARKSVEADSLRRQVDLLLNGADAAAVTNEQLQMAVRQAELDRFFDVVQVCNRPTLLAGGSFEALQELLGVCFRGPDGQPKPLLTRTEVATLSIPRGTLSADERREIESHVTHTFRFLSMIPWTRDLARVPVIARDHHEKLDGTGYPRGIKPEDIALESRMMAVADIYDALTANDRPYKRAVPHEQAIGILEREVKGGQLDGDVFEAFVSYGVAERVLGPPVIQDGKRLSGMHILPIKL